MAKKTFKVAPRENRAASVRGKRRPTQDSGSAAVISFFGWGFAIIFAILMFKAHHDGRKAMARLDATYQASKAELGNDAVQRQEELSEQIRALNATVQGQLDKQKELKEKAMLIERDLPEAEEEAAQASQAAKQLREAATLAEDEAGLSREGLEETARKLDEAADTWRTLKYQYIDRYQAMLRKYENAIQTQNPEKIMMFYNSHRHTPFAPASAYYAGEMFRVNSNKDGAVRMYKEVTNRFKDSTYASLARSRLAQINAGDPQWDANYGLSLVFYPYKALSIATD